VKHAKTPRAQHAENQERYRRAQLRARTLRRLAHCEHPTQHVHMTSLMQWCVLCGAMQVRAVGEWLRPVLVVTLTENVRK